MLYGGLRLRDTDIIQAITNSQVFMGTTRMRQQWFPRLHRKRPGYEARLSLKSPTVIGERKQANPCEHMGTFFHIYIYIYM